MFPAVAEGAEPDDVEGFGVVGVVGVEAAGRGFGAAAPAAVGLFEQAALDGPADQLSGGLFLAHLGPPLVGDAGVVAFAVVPPVLGPRFLAVAGPVGAQGRVATVSAPIASARGGGAVALKLGERLLAAALGAPACGRRGAGRARAGAGRARAGLGRARAGLGRARAGLGRARAGSGHGASPQRDGADRSGPESGRTGVAGWRRHGCKSLWGRELGGPGESADFGFLAGGWGGFDQVGRRSRRPSGRG